MHSTPFSNLILEVQGIDHDILAPLKKWVLVGINNRDRMKKHLRLSKE